MLTGVGNSLKSPVRKKSAKRQASALAVASSKEQRVSAMVSAAASEFSVCASVFDMKIRREPMSDTGARISIKLAMAPAIRGGSSLRHGQDRAVSLVATAALYQQKRFIDAILGAHDSCRSDSGLADASLAFVHDVNWQWDETSHMIQFMAAVRGR
jgi:hypothetical protein